MSDENTSALFSALIAVAEDVGTLRKDDRNEHGKYNFVSIDTYYQQIGQAAVRRGVSWAIRVVDFKINTEGKGHILAVCAFDVFHASGAKIEDFAIFPVVHPIQGAQTCGSLISYADKIFMRQVFKVATGEKDADATDPTDDFLAPPKAEPRREERRAEPRREEPRDVPAAPELPEAAVAAVSKLNSDQLPVLKDSAADDIVEEIFTQFIPTCRSKAALLDFWGDNSTVLKGLEKRDPDRFGRIKALFTKRKDTL